jgi:hypothetical protein
VIWFRTLVSVDENRFENAPAMVSDTISRAADPKWRVSSLCSQKTKFSLNLTMGNINTNNNSIMNNAIDVLPVELLHEIWTYLIDFDDKPRSSQDSRPQREG